MPRTRMPTRRSASLRTGLALAVVLAVVCTVVHQLEVWIPEWQVRGDVPSPVTLRLPSHSAPIRALPTDGTHASYVSVRAARCPRVLARGAMPEAPECRDLFASYDAARRHSVALRHVGGFLFFLLFGAGFALATRHEEGRVRLLRAQVAVFAALALFAVASKIVLLTTPALALALPAAALPLLTRRTLGARVALVTGLAAAGLTSALVQFDIEVFVAEAAAAAGGVVALSQRRPTWTYLRAGLAAGGAAAGATAMLGILLVGRVPGTESLDVALSPLESPLLAAFASGLVSGAVAWLLSPLFAVVVGAVPIGRLQALQDLEHPILARLRDQAPGTWAHSQSMADLAEAVAVAVGADPLLTRVGAYYHDAGKALNPTFFIENLPLGAPNPHDDRTPEESADALVAHVTEGCRALRRAGVPSDVIEFAATHHGDALIAHFWQKASAGGNPRGLTEARFRYPGPRPSTRETGLLMLVDSVEAASRTVDRPDAEGFRSVVVQVLSTKLSEGQLDRIGLSTKDLRVIGETLVGLLVSRRHGRVKYPWQQPPSGPPHTK